MINNIGTVTALLAGGSSLAMAQHGRLKLESEFMFRVLLGGAFAVLGVGAMALIKIPKPAAAQHHAAEPIDRAILTEHLQKLRGQEALP